MITSAYDKHQQGLFSLHLLRLFFVIVFNYSKIDFNAARYFSMLVNENLIKRFNIFLTFSRLQNNAMEKVETSLGKWEIQLIFPVPS